MEQNGRRKNQFLILPAGGRVKLKKHIFEHATVLLHCTLASFKNQVLVLNFLDRFTKCLKAYKKAILANYCENENNPCIISQEYPNF